MTKHNALPMAAGLLSLGLASMASMHGDGEFRGGGWGGPSLKGEELLAARKRKKEQRKAKKRNRK